jgi:type II secretory pathway pseudopilin PulG
MVIINQLRSPARAFLMVELLVGMAILAIAFIPLAYSVQADAREFRAVYQRALAMEIVDGEMEILAAGEWRAFPEGTQTYVVQAAAAKNLPPGQFQFTRHGNHLRLEWSATDKRGLGRIVREVTVP